MDNNASGGYAGLVALLITCLLMAFLIWRMDLFSGTASKGVSPIQQDIGAIKAAEQAKQQLENQYAEQAKDIGS